MAVATEINKNLKYSLLQFEKQEPDLVQNQRVEQLKRQIAAKKESLESIRADISEMMSDLWTSLFLYTLCIHR